MATTKSPEERLAELDKRLEQIKAQKRALINRNKKAERTARNHRLIEIGATVESVLGRPIPKEDLPKLVAFLQMQESRGRYFTRAMSSDSDESVPTHASRMGDDGRQ